MTFRLIRRFGKQYGRNIGNDANLLAQIWDDKATGFPVALLCAPSGARFYRVQDLSLLLHSIFNYEETNTIFDHICVGIRSDTGAHLVLLLSNGHVLDGMSIAVKASCRNTEGCGNC